MTDLRQDDEDFPRLDLTIRPEIEKQLDDMMDDRWEVDTLESSAGLGGTPMMHVIRGTHRHKKQPRSPAILYSRECVDITDFIVELVHEIERLQTRQMELEEALDDYRDAEYYETLQSHYWDNI